MFVEDLAAVILHANGNRPVPWFVAVAVMHAASEVRLKSPRSVF